MRIARSADRLGPSRERVARRAVAGHCGGSGRTRGGRYRATAVVDGNPVSFWHAVTGGPCPVTCELSLSLQDCPWGLPGFDPFGPSAARFAKATGVAETDLEFLRALWADLAQAASSRPGWCLSVRCSTACGARRLYKALSSSRPPISASQAGPVSAALFRPACQCVKDLADIDHVERPPRHRPPASAPRGNDPCFPMTRSTPTRTS